MQQDYGTPRRSCLGLKFDGGKFQIAGFEPDQCAVEEVSVHFIDQTLLSFRISGMAALPESQEEQDDNAGQSNKDREH